jgi:hypothetical protein
MWIVLWFAYLVNSTGCWRSGTLQILTSGFGAVSFFSVHWWQLNATSQMLLFDHRVGRLLSFFSSRNWDSPNPSPPGVCASPPFVLGGGAVGHTRWRGRSWECPNSDDGTYCGTLYIYVLCVLDHQLRLMGTENKKNSGLYTSVQYTLFKIWIIQWKARAKPRLIRTELALNWTCPLYF